MQSSKLKETPIRLPFQKAKKAKSEALRPKFIDISNLAKIELVKDAFDGEFR